MALALVLAACGGDGGEDLAEDPGEDVGVVDTEAPEPTMGGDEPTDGTAIEPRTFTVGKEAWHSGFHMTFGGGVFTGEQDALTDEVDYFVTIDATFENLTDDEWSMAFDQFALVSDGQAIVAALNSELPNVPGGLSSNGSVRFIVDETFDPEVSMLVIGYNDETRAQVPLGDGELIALEPSTAEVDGAIEMELIDLIFSSGDLSYFDPDFYANVEEGKQALTLHFDAVSRRGGNWNIFADGFALILPDGNAVVPESSMLGSLPGSDEGVTTADLSLTFLVADPPTGDYALRLTVGDWFVGEDGVSEGTFEFSLP